MEKNEESKVSIFSQKNWMKTGNNLFDLKEPIVMGILNATPDSFYDGGKHLTVEAAVKRALKMKEEGAGIIDVGGYSSRPGATDISVEEELKRVLPVIKALIKADNSLVISIDSFRSEVAREAVNAGAAIINDISAGELDAGMFKTVAELNVPYIMMHMKGTPQNMQNSPSFENITEEVIDYFNPKVNQLRKLGVADILLDPGFGFGKNIDHNYELLQNLDAFKIFELPIVVGVSRKSMINKVLGIKAAEAKNGGTVLHTIALQKGAGIIRTHDVKEAKEAIKIVKQLQKR